jgi:hypothetical protein
MQTKAPIIETPEYILAVSDEDIKESNYGLITSAVMTYEQMIKEWGEPLGRKIIAYQPKGNVPELDLPLLPQMVEDEVEELPYDKLCYYDTRNSDFQIKKEYGYDKEEVDETGEFSKKDCACDNCFYGRATLADRIIKSATKVYSEEDLKKAIEMARGIKEGKETFTAEDISGCTEVCTYDWKFEFDENEIIQSLKQPKTPKWFVVEMKTVWRRNTDRNVPTKDDLDEELKTTTLEGKTYLVGTYLNE